MNIRNLLSILLVILCIGCNEDDSIALYNASVSVGAEGGSFTLYVTSDAEIKLDCPEWVNLDETIARNGQYAFTFSVPAYYSKEGRKGEIYFRGASEQRMTQVIQQKMSTYVPSDDMSGFGDLNDIQLEIIDGWIKHGNNTGGPTETTGPNVALMWDGNKGQNTSMCNSPWADKWFPGLTGDELTQAKQALFLTS